MRWPSLARRRVHLMDKVGSQAKVRWTKCQVPVADTGPGLAVLQPEAWLSKSMVNHLNNEGLGSRSLFVAIPCVSRGFSARGLAWSWILPWYSILYRPPHGFPSYSRTILLAKMVLSPFGFATWYYLLRLLPHVCCSEPLFINNITFYGFPHSIVLLYEESIIFMTFGIWNIMFPGNDSWCWCHIHKIYKECYQILCCNVLCRSPGKNGWQVPSALHLLRTLLYI